MVSLTCGITKFIETEGRKLVSRGRKGAGNKMRRVGISRCKLSVIRYIGSEDLMYNMVTTIGNTMLCNCSLLT